MKAKCPHCGATEDYADDLAGMSIPCRKCDESFQTPSVEMDEERARRKTTGKQDRRWPLFAAALFVLIAAVLALLGHRWGSQQDRLASPASEVAEFPDLPVMPVDVVMWRNEEQIENAVLFPPVPVTRSMVRPYVRRVHTIYFSNHPDFVAARREAGFVWKLVLHFYNDPVVFAQTARQHKPRGALCIAICTSDPPLRHQLHGVPETALLKERLELANKLCFLAPNVVW